MSLKGTSQFFNVSLGDNTKLEGLGLGDCQIELDPMAS